MNRVAIVGGLRIPFVKSFSHYLDCSNQEMLTVVLKELVNKFALNGKQLGDVALGAVMKHSSDWNLARECVLGSGLDPKTPGFDLQRACGTSLEAVIQLANKIALGQIEVGIAGGSDTNSDAPVMVSRNLSRRFIRAGKTLKGMRRLFAFSGFRPNELVPHFPDVVEPRTMMSMGEHCEEMAKEWKVSREDQDRLALQSHQNGSRAYREGFYEDLIISFRGLKRDSTLRDETSMEKLATLKPAFDKSKLGTLTAGNSSPLSDGADAVLLASEAHAKREGLPILAYFRDAQVSAVDFVNKEGLLMAPAYAVSELLSRNKMELKEFDFFEIHEAFAAQVLCTLKAWESEEYCNKNLGRSAPMGVVDRLKLNCFGGSVALGHPFAATGARIVGTLGKALQGKASRGLVSVCTGGGMGVAAILEGTS